MIRDCLVIMESGSVEDLFEIIPRVGVLRSPAFHQPLLDLLKQENTKRREFAAYAMGAMGDKIFLEPLQKAFSEAHRLKGGGREEFQLAVIEAIGAIGDDAAAEFFLPHLQQSGGGMMRMQKWMVEALGAIAQQGGERSLEALLELTRHPNAELRAQSISEISVAYWHRPNEIADNVLRRIGEMTADRSRAVAESAVAALQSLADVGCRQAERLFSNSRD